jgi:inosose dehydratase
MKPLAMNPAFLRHTRSPLNRRSFLKSAGTALLACAAAKTRISAEEPKIPVGSNIYGWSQYYQRDGKNVNEHLDEVLSALRDAGYDYLEAFMDVNRPENNARLAERMRAKGLRPICLYTGARLHEPGGALETVQKLLEASRAAQKAGFTVINCNPDPIGREKTDTELDTQAGALGEFGAGLVKLGMKLGIHNHTPEMLNEAREFHHMLKRTNPDHVGLCYDVHWVHRGGMPVEDCLRLYGSRIVSWHLRQSRDGVWWEDLDSGDIDYALAAAFARKHRLTAPYTVELAIEKGTKITRSAVENHRRSRDFVRRVFGV